MTTLEIQGAIKRYPDGTEAVKGVSVDVAEGELVVFVGPSGCGKSTLLRMVAGLETVTEGVINLRGRKVNDLEPAERDIAMVFQNYALYPHMTVRRNLAYGLKNRGISRDRIDRKVADAAELLQIAEFLDRKPGALSGGQRQRVAMGRAIVRDPAIFLFDEPLSNLDAKLRNQMRLEIKGLQRRLATAAVYVTHDQVEAMTLADRIVVLNGGRVEQIGTPTEIYRAPASTFVASFIGAPPMNLIATEAEAGAVRLDGQGLALPGAPSGAVTLGVRPEDLHTSAAGEGFRISVTAIEELGATRLIHGRLDGTDIVAVQPASQVAPEAEAWLSPDPGAMHLFDAGTGARL